MSKRVYLVVLSLPTATLAFPAYAYLDPGTGSMILQILLSGLAGAVVVGKLYWLNIRSYFGLKPKGEAAVESEDETDRK